MASDHYLTRSDIAKILKISLRQASQLICEMPFVQVSPRQRRVALEDFEAWCDARRTCPKGIKRVASRRDIQSVPIRRHQGGEGSILAAARKALKDREIDGA